jgi:hypothetical protein
MHRVPWWRFWLSEREKREARRLYVRLAAVHQAEVMGERRGE